MGSAPAVLEVSGGIATVFDVPRPIAFFENGTAWAVVRTAHGLVHGQASKSDWKLKLGGFTPLPGDGSFDYLIEKKLTKGNKTGHFMGEIALNPNDPVPNVNFPVHNLEHWRRQPVNFINTGTVWVGRLKEAKKEE